MLDTEPKLTKREFDVAELRADGLSRKQIASKLVISIKTVDTHLFNIHKKMGVTNRVQLANRFREISGSINKSTPIIKDTNSYFLKRIFHLPSLLSLFNESIYLSII